jgi:hypothetical protein
MLTAAPLAGIASRLEQLGRSGSLAGAESLLVELGNEVKRVIDHLPFARVEAAGIPIPS